MIRWLLLIGMVAMLGRAGITFAQTRIQWDSQDLMLSKRPPYKYIMPKPYETPSDPKAPSPGSNFMIGLEVSDDPPKVADRLLTRQAKLTGSITAAPGEASGGKVRLEDNYGRVLDEANLAGPAFAFKLDASRSISTGLYLKAELTDGQKVIWSASQPLRMVPAGDPWRDFVLGVYNMGTQPGTGELWREIGLGHRAVQTTVQPSEVAQWDMRFHASNILYSLLGFYHRDLKRWREIKAAQAEQRGPIQLRRHRCLNDPKEKKFITDILTAAAMIHGPYQPLDYSIGDEIGIGNMAAPADLCASPWCRQRFIQLLKDAYGSLDKLNAQWETRYGSWEEVEMFSTWMALDRAKTGNFSPWADRLEFNDAVLAEAVALGVKAVRTIDPGAMCNVSGVQQPSCWGFDHWRLTRVVNSLTPYDIGEGPDVILSFYNDGKDGKVRDPGFGDDCQGLWQAFFRGYAMCQQWDSFGGATYSRLIDIEAKKPTPFGQQVKTWAEWVHSGPGRLRNRAERARDPVAILYSQPSLRGNWILEITGRSDIPETGAEWARRDSYTVRQKELAYRVRVSWVQWSHDVGIWPKFVDASQVEQGCLQKDGYKVLIMPRAAAISDATAEAIRRFVRAGGTVIADSWPGIMDEHCRVRPKGALDDLFGVSRGDYREIDVAAVPADGQGVKLGDAGFLPFRAFEKTLKAGKLENVSAGGSANGADVDIARTWPGGGKARYLNFNLEQYFLQRFYPDVAAPARRYLLRLLAEAGVRPLFPLSDPGGKDAFHGVGHEVCIYRSGRGYLVGVLSNPTVRNSELGGVADRYTHVKDNPFFKTHPARLGIPAGMYVYDLVAGKALGKVEAVEFQSAPQGGHMYACWPFEIQGVEATAEVGADRRLKLAGKVVTSSPAVEEKLAVALRVFRPDGSEQRAYRQTLDVEKGAFALELPLGINEHGEWKLVVREPCTGKEARSTARLP